MLPGWGEGTPKVGSIKGDPIVIGPRKNPQGTEMVIWYRKWEALGGTLSWAWFLGL